ncbi:Helix-turn-helix domain-containing protein [Bosea lupini]|uniref:Helix-turn-helix domain-containing protein n=1 Tax=Bosea lupini TaxID=1036779 RepID=A0A1H7PW74_9HYPH|nr:helix-turn-helix domain-containing protein [Bosea lupini]SEL39708.1 Helix-turn-helix domain-containing protein [Bosea lupini]
MQFAGRNYLSSRQVCERHGIVLRTLYRYMKREGFPKAVSREGRLFFAEDDLLAWEKKIVGAELGARAAA